MFLFFHIDSRDYGPVPIDLIVGRIKYKVGFLTLTEVAKAAPVDPFESVFQLVSDSNPHTSKSKSQSNSSHDNTTNDRNDNNSDHQGAPAVVPEEDSNSIKRRYNEGGLATISDAADFHRIFAAVTINSANTNSNNSNTITATDHHQRQRHQHHHHQLDHDKASAKSA